MRRLSDRGLPVSFAVVFGSRATGTADEWSDIDFLIVSPRFVNAVDREDVMRLWRVAARTDSRIEPIPCGERQRPRGFIGKRTVDTSKAIIEIARREGTRILPAA